MYVRGVIGVDIKEAGDVSKVTRRHVVTSLSFQGEASRICLTERAPSTRLSHDLRQAFLFLNSTRSSSFTLKLAATLISIRNEGMVVICL